MDINPEEQHLQVVARRRHRECQAVDRRARVVALRGHPGGEVHVVIGLSDHRGQQFERPDRAVGIVEP
jgi:hypothetical protein